MPVQLLDGALVIFYYSYQYSVYKPRSGMVSNMVLSQKSQYAVRAVFELARRHGGGPVKAGQIAEAQYVPARFLENILGQLRQAGIIESTRGKGGGYRLRRAPGDVSVGEVIRSIQGPMSAIDCAEVGIAGSGGNGRSCPLRPGCVLLPVWDKAHSAMMDVFEGTTFGDLLEQERAMSEYEPADYII
jgi:Rrf2 family transcriptional regulator, cysteine metabolism repressor